ncbi:MAG: tetratricopeptide repeat protein, partial [Cytophagaceae bacterium]
MIRSLLLFFILFPLLAAAQSAELSEAYQKKMTYQNAKDYKSATVWGEKAISLAEKEFGKTSANYGNYASDLASLYQLKSEFDLAGKWYLVSYKIYSGTYGADHAYTSTTAYNLALVNQSQGKSAEAESYFLKAIQGYEKSLGTGHDYYKMVLQSIIQFYDKNGEYRKLDPFLQTDLEIVARKSGRSGAEYAAALNNLALNYSHLNDFAAAEKNYLEA